MKLPKFHIGNRWDWSTVPSIDSLAFCRTTTAPIVMSKQYNKSNFVHSLDIFANPLLKHFIKFITQKNPLLQFRQPQSSSPSSSTRLTWLQQLPRNWNKKEPMAMETHWSSLKLLQVGHSWDSVIAGTGWNRLKTIYLLQISNDTQCVYS